MNVARAAENVIEYSFWALLFFVPLVWLPVNSELFEFNKMLLTYAVSAVIITAWAIKSIEEKRFYIRKTPLDVFLGLFLLASIASTIFSIDTHTSIFGYYSRSHGGLFSTIAYYILFYAAATFLDREKIINLLKVSLLSGFIISVWAILSHFGYDPACLILDKKLYAGCWSDQFNPTLRAFSTLGQPNWLAAYLAMLIPTGLSFMLISKKFWERTSYLVFLIMAYLAFTFTYSRGGMAGLVVGLSVFAVFLFLNKETSILAKFFEKIHFSRPKLKISIPPLMVGWAWIGAFVVASLAISLIWGNAFFRGGLRLPTFETPQAPQTSSQLETGGTESGQIRLIVWKGAVEVFKHYPLFGSGLETFAYSYYQFRPAEHNLTSEWDFLYNKAHNEYLNFLATTGIVGFITYLLVIITFSLLVLKYLFRVAFGFERLLVTGLFAGFVSYLVQNFFGFSVVPIAIFFFLFPVFFFQIAGLINEKNLIYLNERFFKFTKNNTIKNFVSVAILLIGFALIFLVGKAWLADTYYASSFSLNSVSNYENLKLATLLRPEEPLYKSQLAVAAATIASSVGAENERQKFLDEAITLSTQTTKEYPNNINMWRNKARVYFELTGIDQGYIKDTIESSKKIAQLAPTEAKIQYNLGALLVFDKNWKEATSVLEKTVALKADYRDARILLAKAYWAQGRKKEAKEELKQDLNLFPNDSEAKKLLLKYE